MKKEKLFGLAAATAALTVAVAPMQAEARGGCSPRPVHCGAPRGGAVHHAPMPRAPMHHASMYRAPVYHRPVHYAPRYYGGYYGSRPYYGGYWGGRVVVGGYYPSYGYAVSTPVVVQQPVVQQTVVQQPVYTQPAPVYTQPVQQPVYAQPAPVSQAAPAEVKVVVEHQYQLAPEVVGTNKVENVRE